MPLLGIKRPAPAPIPETTTEQQPIQGNTIVVIHPGSLYLRLGRASDTYPLTVPHCIARRHKVANQRLPFEDAWMLRPEYYEIEEIAALKKEALRAAEDLVQSKPNSIGGYRKATYRPEITDLNEDGKPQLTDIPSPHQWTNTRHKPPFLIGDQALYIHPRDSYDLHWPIRHGKLNIHSGIGGTLTAVMQDLENIWGTAIQNSLEIPLKDLKHYRAVLLIPDAYYRQHVREMVEMLLNRLGFGGAFVVQESACATFGAGVSSACVVDMGDQKTSISCVEDGISQKSTRFCMDIGGSDIARCFHSLLVEAGFPYKECDLADRIDALLMKDLKESLCHMDQDIEDVELHHIQVKRPSHNITRYSMYIGDERILAPMSVFYPDILGLDGPNLCHVQEKYRSDPNDPHDEDYLVQTMSRHEQAARLLAARKRENAEAASQSLDGTSLEEPQLDDDDTMDPNDPDVTSSGKHTRKPWDEDDDCMDVRQGLMGIDQAILKSIDKCESDEMKRRMYSCVVVVGGGLMFTGTNSWLQHLIWTQMPVHHRITLENMEIMTQPKELDPCIVCWKGASVMCCLDTAQELWIKQPEWDKLGVRTLREKAPFIWV